MEVPRLGVESELQMPAYTTATVTAMQDLSRVCDLHHSSWQCWILNPLSEARYQTHNLMLPSQIHFCCAMTGTPKIHLFQKNFWSSHHASVEMNLTSIHEDGGSIPGLAQ